ncbi:MAG: hypothetical protein BWY99_02514 [Synergistetes bacterium ADurb.BinA166]|nr:MAG: hypothetical protein BWY99_02514 [Synergistetes bacterium ADurb.BinA166]
MNGSPDRTILVSKTPGVEAATRSYPPEVPVSTDDMALIAFSARARFESRSRP